MAKAELELEVTIDPSGWAGCPVCAGMVAPGKEQAHREWHDLLAGRVEEAEATAKRALASSERRREELQALARSVLSAQENIERMGQLCAKGDYAIKDELEVERKRITTVAQASLRHAEALTRSASAIATVRDVLGSLRAVVLRHDSVLRGRQ